MTKQENSINIIGFGTHLEGKLQSDQAIRMEGELVGDLTTSDRFILGQEGRLKGTVVAKVIDIAGSVDGVLRSQELVTLRKGAIVEGTVYCPNLEIELGAILNGEVSMRKEIANPIGVDKSQDRYESKDHKPFDLQLEAV